VAFFSAMMRDTRATRCVDLTPGSGAAAVAAISSGVQYMGLCHNQAHQLWLQNLLERIFLALVQEKQVAGIEKDLLDNVGKYLQRAASAAKQLLPKNSKLAAFEPIVDCDDDSGDEEE
jgi:16S rRNA G966 N2-methylase RsmD